MAAIQGASLQISVRLSCEKQRAYDDCFSVRDEFQEVCGQGGHNKEGFAAYTQKQFCQTLLTVRNGYLYVEPPPRSLKRQSDRKSVSGYSGCGTEGEVSGT